MAIVKMKKLFLASMISQRDELLKKLAVLGCVEISRGELPAEDCELFGLLRQDSAGYYERKSEYDSVVHALALLDKYAPEKTSILTPRPIVDKRVILDHSSLEQNIRLARTIDDADDQIRTADAQLSHFRGELESLEPWRAMDVPLDTESTGSCTVEKGTVPAFVSVKDLEEALKEADCAAALYEIFADQDARYLFLVCYKSDSFKALDALRELGWSKPSLSGYQGTAEENIHAITQRIAQLEEKKLSLAAEIKTAAIHRKALKLCSDRLMTMMEEAEHAERMLYTRSAFTFEGWVPASREKELEAVLAEYDCAWETRDPTEEENDQVPVSLKNNWFTRPLNMVTEMYSLPAYGTVDPNPLMAPFFILFYGIMMADMGYGLLMMLASYFVTKKVRPRATMDHMFRLAGLCGITTFIFGAITGGFFGDFIPQLAKLINPNTTLTALPALFTPLDDTLMILVGSLALGLVHIVTGMAISFVCKIKRGQIMDAIWEELTWWVVFAGLGLMILGITPVVLIVGGVMIVVGSGWNAKGFGKVTAIFGSIYNHVTGYFGDILSYSRLMALMLAGSVIAQVFNTLGAIPGNVFIFLIISLVGNALNFALNILGCYVHDLRLQCLEYFGKFYADGGKPFNPLSLKTEYVDVK